MDIKEFEILGEAIENHWYYFSKARAMQCFLNAGKINKILDVGAGSGYFSKYLLKNSEAKEATLVDTSYKSNENERYLLKKIYKKKSINKCNASHVLLMDVLEHVDDEKSFLEDYVRKVPKGTKFLITVPAFNFLWSSHDIFLEHRRRYTIKSLKKITEESGLKIHNMSYFFAFVFPFAATTRLLLRVSNKNNQKPRSSLKKYNILLNFVLKTICLIEIYFFKHNKYFGLSIFSLAEK